MALLIRLAPILLAVAYALALWKFSTWRLSRELDANSKPLQDPGLVAKFRQMGLAVGLPKLTAHLYDKPVINGLAAPDGRIFITRGLYERHRMGHVTGDEIAGVVAHELGHVALGHHKRRMINWAGQNAARVVLTMLIARFIPFVGVWLVNAIASLVTAKLSRDDEFEADAYATALMTRAGLDAGAQISLLRKLEAMQPGLGTGGQAAWLASHPSVDDRVKRIESLRAGWDGQSGS